MKSIIVEKTPRW